MTTTTTGTTPIADRLRAELAAFGKPESTAEHIMAAQIGGYIRSIVQLEPIVTGEQDYIRRRVVEQQIAPLRAAAEAFLYAIEIYRSDGPQVDDGPSELDQSLAEHMDNRRRAKERMDGLRRGMGLDL